MQIAWGVLSTQKLWWLQTPAVAVFVPARRSWCSTPYTCVGAFFPGPSASRDHGGRLPTLGGRCAIPASRALRAWLVASMDAARPERCVSGGAGGARCLAGAASRIVKLDSARDCRGADDERGQPHGGGADDEAAVELAEFFVGIRRRRRRVGIVARLPVTDLPRGE